MFNIIGISGKQGVGKNYYASLLSKKFNENNIKTMIVGFADYLKYTIINNSSILTYNNIFIDRSDKERQMLQSFGEKYRKINENYWIDPLYNFMKHNSLINGIQLYLIADVRMLNELNFIKDHKGLIIRIKGKNYRNLDTIIDKKILNHISEIDLDNYNNFDIIINNNDNVNKMDNVNNNIDKINKIINQHFQLTFIEPK